MDVFQHEQQTIAVVGTIRNATQRRKIENHHKKHFSA